MIIWINNNKFCDALHRVRWLRAKAEYMDMKRAPEWQLATGNTSNIIHTRFIMWWIYGVAALRCRLPFLRFSRSVSYLIPCILLTISSRLIFLFSSFTRSSGRSFLRSCWLCGSFGCTWVEYAKQDLVHVVCLMPSRISCGSFMVKRDHIIYAIHSCMRINLFLFACFVQQSGSEEEWVSECAEGVLEVQCSGTFIARAHKARKKCVRLRNF